LELSIVTESLDGTEVSAEATASGQAFLRRAFQGLKAADLVAAMKHGADLAPLRIAPQD